jgi:hypothetical protein
MIIVGRIQNDWNRQRKMAFQLGIISFVYLIVWIPLSIAQLGQIYIDSTFLHEQLDTLGFLVYIISLILPVVCLISMPEFIKKIKTFIFRHQRIAVMPMTNKFIRQININGPSLNNGITKF